MPRPKTSMTETQLEAKDSFGMGDVRKVKAFRGEELDPAVPRSRIQTRTYLLGHGSDRLSLYLFLPA